MRKLILASFIASFAFVLSVYALPSYAQQNTDTGLYNTDSSLKTDTGTTGTVDNKAGFDWRWLLPLLAVPVLYLLWRGTADDSRDYDDSGYAVGAKGGRSVRGTRDDESDEEEDKL